MEGYRTLTEATAVALNVCHSWRGAETGDTYGVREMSYIAQITDIESPNTSDEIFYCVFPDGEIGLLCTFDRSIRRLYIPSGSSFVPSPDMLLGIDDDMIADSAAPHAYDADGNAEATVPSLGRSTAVSGARDYFYCMYCGTKLSGQISFCPECGRKIEVR